MASWTIVLQERTDGVIMLGANGIALEPIPADVKVCSTAFSNFYACYTSDNEITVNDNLFTVQNTDSGSLSNGVATITVSPLIPNSAQCDTIKNNQYLK